MHALDCIRAIGTYEAVSGKRSIYVKTFVSTREGERERGRERESCVSNPWVRTPGHVRSLLLGVGDPGLCSVKLCNEILTLRLDLVRFLGRGVVVFSQQPAGVKIVSNDECCIRNITIDRRTSET